MHAIFRLHRPLHRLSVVSLRVIRGSLRVTPVAVGSGAEAATGRSRPASPYRASVRSHCAISRNLHTRSLIGVRTSWSISNCSPGRIGGSGSTARLKGRNRALLAQMDAAHSVTATESASGTVAALPKAYVRTSPGGDTLVVAVSIGPKTCNLNRPTNEPLDKALTRLAKNLMTKPSKKEKRKKPPGPSADTSLDEAGAGVGAVLYEDPEGTCPLDRSLPNGVAWLRGALLEVAGERFSVEVNPPTVDKLSIDWRAMVGYPSAAAVSLSYSDASACKWRWSAQRPGGSSGAWVDLGCSTQYYTPTPADEGSVLRVECTPAAFRRRHRRCQQQQQQQSSGGSDGVAAGADTEMATAPVSDGAVVGEEDVEDGGEVELRLGDTVSGVTGPVQHGPQTSSATIRCVHTPTAVQPPGFRILSYNILADQYAGSTYAQNVLFNYCPTECLDPGYRRPLVLRELLGYRADVMCLQEVDERAFTDYFALHLGLQGYSGHYTNKQGRVREGSATFWRTCRFTALAHKNIRLREAFARPLPPLHAQFEPLLVASPELTSALQQVTTIAQATLLAPRDGQGQGQGQGAAGGGGGNCDDGDGGCLCVVNTHLFFHPYAPHIRTMHTAAILEEVAAFLKRCDADPELAGALGDRRPTVLFVGDLNSDLNDGIPGVIELLRRGQLPADYWDWVQGAAFKWGMGEEDAEAMAQGTAQIAAAAAAAATKSSTAVEEQATPASPATEAGTAAALGNGSAVLHATSPATVVDAASASASLGSLFAADGHAFDSTAAAPHSPIAVTGIDITSPFVLRSADDLATPYTNYTSGYKALLDYVWYEESALRVVRSVPIPSHAELTSFIPSPAFPSDHLAVVYDMEWLQEGA